MVLWQILVEWLQSIGWIDRDPATREQFVSWVVPLAIAGARQDWMSKKGDAGRWNVGGNGPDDFNGVLRAWYLGVCVPVLWNKRAKWVTLNEFKALAWWSRWGENRPGRVWIATVPPAVLLSFADACSKQSAAGNLAGVYWAPAGQPAALPPVRFWCCTPLKITDKMPAALAKSNWAPIGSGESVRPTVRWKREFALPGQAGPFTRHIECVEMTAGNLGGWQGFALHDSWYNRTDLVPGDIGARDRMTLLEMAPERACYCMARFRWGDGINWGALWNWVVDVVGWAVDIAGDVFGVAVPGGGIIDRAADAAAGVIRGAGIDAVNTPTGKRLRDLAGTVADHADLFRSRYQAADTATRAEMDAFIKALEG